MIFFLPVNPFSSAFVWTGELTEARDGAAAVKLIKLKSKREVTRRTDEQQDDGGDAGEGGWVSAGRSEEGHFRKTHIWYFYRHGRSKRRRREGVKVSIVINHQHFCYLSLYLFDALGTSEAAHLGDGPFPKPHHHNRPSAPPPDSHQRFPLAPAYR